MGDESITRPPSFTKSERTSSSCRRISDVRSTSNVCHVPRPITGSFSPDEGIARVNIVDDSVAAHIRDAPDGRTKPAAPAVINRAASRRVIWFVLLIVMSSPATAGRHLSLSKWIAERDSHSASLRARLWLGVTRKVSVSHENDPLPFYQALRCCLRRPR